MSKHTIGFVMVALLLALAGAVAALTLPGWRIEAACDGEVYVYTLTNLDRNPHLFDWRNDDILGQATLNPGEQRVVRSESDWLLVVAYGLSDYEYHAGEHCHAARGPVPAYLLAAPGVSGPATWACNGSRVNHADGSAIVTPGQTFVWQGVETPVTVLILSSYLDPATCSVEGAAPAWYVDYTRWTCLAYTGDDAGCGGAADFH